MGVLHIYVSIFRAIIINSLYCLSMSCIILYSCDVISSLISIPYLLGYFSLFFERFCQYSLFCKPLSLIKKSFYLRTVCYLQFSRMPFLHYTCYIFSFIIGINGQGQQTRNYVYKYIYTGYYISKTCIKLTEQIFKYPIIEVLYKCLNNLTV